MNLPDAISSRSLPFGGLIPDTVQGRILQELAADPFSFYSPKVMADLTDCSVLSVSRSLKHLESMGLLTNISKDRQHPVFHIREGSRTINALIFLTLAWQDDLDGSDLMDECVRDYAERTLAMGGVDENKANANEGVSSLPLPVLKKGRRATMKEPR